MFINTESFIYKPATVTDAVAKFSCPPLLLCPLPFAIGIDFFVGYKDTQNKDDSSQSPVMFRSGQ